MTLTKRKGRPPKVAQMPAPVPDFNADLPKTPPEKLPKDRGEDEPEGTKAHSRGIPEPRQFDLAPEDFFRYWLDIEKIEPGRFVLYMYRVLPVCDVLLPLTVEELKAIRDKKAKAPVTYILKLKAPPVEAAADWNRWACETKGAGDYHFKLNDHHPSVKKTIAMCTTKGEGALRDWGTYPPVVEVDQVVLADPLNESYLRWARLAGIKFPGDPGTASAIEPEESEEMASIVETLQNSNLKMQDKIVEMASKPAAAAPVDAGSRAQLGAVETIVDASKQGNKILGDAMRTVLESQAKAADPHEHLRSVIEMAKAIQPPPAAPPPDNTAIYMQMMKQNDANFERILKIQSDSHQAQSAALLARLESMEKQLTESRQKPETAASTDEAVLDKYLRIKKKFRELDEEEGGEPGNEGPAWLAPALSFGEKIMSNVTSSLQALAAIRTNTPQAPAPMPDPAALPVVNAVPEEDEATKMKKHWAQQMHQPIVSAMRAGSPGYEFAAAVIAEAGPQGYDYLARGGYNGVMDFLRAHPPLFAELMQPPLVSMLDKFIAEFLDGDKVNAALAILKGQAPPQNSHRGPKVNTVQ